MSTAVNPPKTPITAGSKAIAAATLPNVCKMPGPPAPFVPTPLPNIGKSDNSPQGYSTTVTIDGAAVAIQGATFNSIGDVASQGTGGGIVSNNVQGPTSFIAPGSMDVKVEGKNVQLLGDQMLNNGGPSGSPANAATMMGAVQAPGQPVPLAVVEGVLCTIFCECLAQEQARKFEMPLPDVEAVYDPEFDPDVKPGRAGQSRVCREEVQRRVRGEHAEREGRTDVRHGDESPVAVAGLLSRHAGDEAAGFHGFHPFRSSSSRDEIPRRPLAAWPEASLSSNCWGQQTR